MLVNPGVSVSTGEIFKAMDTVSANKPMKLTSRKGDLLSRALSGENDMQEFAIKQVLLFLMFCEFCLSKLRVSLRACQGQVPLVLEFLGQMPKPKMRLR